MEKIKKTSVETRNIQITSVAVVICLLVIDIAISLIANTYDVGSQLFTDLFGIVFAVIAFFVSEKSHYKMAFPVFFVVILILVNQLVAGSIHNETFNRWLNVGSFYIKTSALIPLVSFAFAKMITLYRKYSHIRVILLVAPLMLCFMLVYAQNNIYPVFMGLMVAYIVYSKMHFEKRIKEKFVFYFMWVLIIVAVIIFATQASKIEISQFMSHRIQVILTRGKIDPIGAGWTRVFLDGIMKETPLFGATNYIADLKDVTIFEHLYNMGNHNIVIILAKLGWIPFMLFIVGYIAFLSMLYDMTSKTNQSSFAKYVSFIFSTILTVKVICCLIGFFWLDCIHNEMPFMSSFTGNVVDLVLFGVILGLYRKRNEPTRIIQINKEWRISDEMRFYANEIKEERKVYKKKKQKYLHTFSEYFRITPQKNKQNKKKVRASQINQSENHSEQKDYSYLRTQNQQIKYTFMSYSSENKDMADKTEEILKKNGIYVWRDSKGIPPGRRYAEILLKAIKNCSCFVLLLTEESQKSDWVSKEVERAINYGKPIVTIKIGCFEVNEEFEMYISNSHYVDVPTINENLEEFIKVIKSVKKYTDSNLL